MWNVFNSEGQICCVKEIYFKSRSPKRDYIKPFIGMEQLQDIIQV